MDKSSGLNIYAKVIDPFLKGNYVILMYALNGIGKYTTFQSFKIEYIL